jgi:hypothetical protein
MANGTFRENLASLGIDSAAQLLSFFYLDAEAVHSYLQGVDEVNSDDHPIIEYTAPKYLLAYQRAGAFYDIFKHSLKARLPLHPASLVAALENDRIRQRIPYYRKWGIPEHVIQQMLQAHGN